MNQTLEKKQKIVSGITVSGNLTIAHYLTIIKLLVKLKDQKKLFVFIADLHANTESGLNNLNLRENTFEMAKFLIAGGLDKDQLFIQSRINGLGKMTFIFGCLVSYSKLRQMEQYQSKSQDNKTPFALLNYPLLMASDILLYDADVVVGNDQKQHIELARDLTNRINNFYKEKIFHLPEIINEKDLTFKYRVRNLRYPEKKMSKSDKNLNNVIFLKDSETDIRKKIKKATMDSENKILFDFDKKPGVSNLILLYALTKDLSIEKAEKFLQNNCKNYLDLKNIVSDVICEAIIPLRKKFDELDTPEGMKKVKEILDAGAKKAQKEVDKQLEKVQNNLGYQFFNN